MVPVILIRVTAPFWDIHPPSYVFIICGGGGRGVTTWKARSAVSHILVFQSLLGQTYIYFFVWDGGDTCFKYPFLFLTRGPKNTFLGGFSVFFLGVFFYCQPWSDQRYESGSFHQKT
jgi:hypothetical protein